MCYINGPLCSEYAAAWVELAEKRYLSSRSTASIEKAKAFRDQAYASYDMTPQGQEVLRNAIKSGTLPDAP